MDTYHNNVMFIVIFSYYGKPVIVEAPTSGTWSKQLPSPGEYTEYSKGIIRALHMKAIQKEMVGLREENEILKKAMAILAKM